MDKIAILAHHSTLINHYDNDSENMFLEIIQTLCFGTACFNYPWDVSRNWLPNLIDWT